MVGQAGAWEHICHMCQGKAAKRLFRQVTKRQKRREERRWRKEWTA
jgi:hypothetical protein